MPADPAPRSLQFSAESLRIEWPEGSTTLAATSLRRHCRCAECQRIARDGGTPPVAEGLQLVDVLPVGAYGVQLRFSDGHDRGIYPWAYLRSF